MGVMSCFRGLAQTLRLHPSPSTSSSQTTLPRYSASKDGVTIQVKETKSYSPIDTPKLVVDRPAPIDAAIIKKLEEVLKPKPQIFITGLGTNYPPHLLTAQDVDDYIRKTCDVDNEPGLQKLLHLNTHTKIDTRHLILPLSSPHFNLPTPPTLTEINTLFATHSLPLTLTACRAALDDASLQPEDITHTVAVTSTHFSIPGYDFAVTQALGLDAGIERVLLTGVGCAGGMSALRSAFNLSLAASARGKLARILVMACELSSLNIRAALEELIGDARSMNITPVLFGDGASAVVVCNEFAVAVSGEGKEKYEVLEWGCETLEGTRSEMELSVGAGGFRAHIGKNVPSYAINSIPPMLNRLLPSSQVDDLDWAIHPGGISILKGAEKFLKITGQHMRASYDVYAKRGNTASVTVLSVLDTLRKMGEGREKVVACSFGPGMVVEMAVLKRC